MSEAMSQPGLLHAKQEPAALERMGMCKKLILLALREAALLCENQREASHLPSIVFNEAPLGHQLAYFKVSLHLGNARRVSVVRTVQTPCKSAAMTCAAPSSPCMLSGHARTVR